MDASKIPEIKKFSKNLLEKLLKDPGLRVLLEKLALRHSIPKREVLKGLLQSLNMSVATAKIEEPDSKALLSALTKISNN